MEYNEIAAKRHKKLKSYCVYAPFASLRGYSLFPFCSLCCGLFSNPREQIKLVRSSNAVNGLAIATGTAFR
jgi:hypothetical protein